MAVYKEEKTNTWRAVYENKTKHAGRRIQLTYMVVEASAFEVIE